MDFPSSRLSPLCPFLVWHSVFPECQCSAAVTTSLAKPRALSSLLLVLVLATPVSLPMRSLYLSAAGLLRVFSSPILMLYIMIKVVMKHIFPKKVWLLFDLLAKTNQNETLFLNFITFIETQYSLKWSINENLRFLIYIRY